MNLPLLRGNFPSWAAPQRSQRDVRAKGLNYVRTVSLRHCEVLGLDDSCERRSRASFSHYTTHRFALMVAQFWRHSHRPTHKVWQLLDSTCLITPWDDTTRTNLSRVLHDIPHGVPPPKAVLRRSCYGGGTTQPQPPKSAPVSI